MDQEGVPKMTAIVEFTVPSEAFELGQALQIPNVRLKLFQLIPRGNRFVPYLWVHVSDGDFTEFESQLESDYRVDQAMAVEAEDNERLYRINWATELNGLFAGFRSHGLSIDYAKGTPERWEFRVFNREHENLESFQKYCADHDIPLQVERVYHPTPPGKPPDWGLTREQQGALVTAYEQGYFQVPQEVSLEDLGEQLDVSRQAVSDRLHRGLQNLLSQTLVMEDAEEPL